ncbi:MAG TPA: DUF6455 family protein [Burkholderiales bacterium]|nr:DUF6455 family protein [Burkholderiales bacterium]
MEAFTAALLPYAPTAIVAGVATLVALVLWRSAGTRDRPLALGQMLARQGAEIGLEFSPAEARQLAEAARRCFNCGAMRACDEFLVERRPGMDYRTFCPNASYIEELKRTQR